MTLLMNGQISKHLSMKKIFILILSVILIPGCKKKDSFLVKGTINGTNRESIIINRIDINTIQFVDSARINSKGSFRIRIKTTEPDFYQVGFSSTNFMTLLAQPGEKITINFTDENLYKNYTVTGSEGSQQVKTLDLKLLDTRRKIDSLNSVFREASLAPGFDTVQPRLTQEILDLVRAQRKFNIEFIVSHINSFASIKALYQKLNDETYVLYETRDLQYFKIVSDSLKFHYPDSRHTKALLKTVDDGIKQLNAIRLNQMISTLPETKLDPVLKDINGRTVSVSSLKGRYVLLAFWSSESRDCVVENLQLKE